MFEIERQVNIMADKGNENLMGAGAYLLWWVTGIIFLVIEKENKFVRYHAMQSLLLFGPIHILLIVLSFVPIIGWLVGIFLSLGAFILWIICMWKAFQGEMFKLPYVSPLVEKQLAKMAVK
jgi:uncharacterized membrane protein